MRTLVMVEFEPAPVERDPADDVRPRFAESEPVIVDTDTDGAVVLEFDNGQRMLLDEVELRAALERKAA